MNANAARLRIIVPLTAAIALLLSAAAACLSLGFVSAHELSPQPALASAQELAPPPAPERLPHPHVAPPVRPAPETPPEPAPERAVQPAPQGAISTQQDNSAKKPRNVTLTRKTYSEETSAGLSLDWDAPQDTSTFSTYEIQYRRSGTGWMNFTGPIDHTNLAASLEGLISGTTYEAKVRGAGGAHGPWSDTVSATTNTAPSATDSTLGDAWNVNLGETKQGTISGHFTDVDGDTLTYQVWTGSPALLSVGTSNDGNGQKVSATVLNPGGTSFYYRVRDAYGGQSATKSHQVTGTANVTRTVAENSPAGTAVGAPVAGTPYDDGNDQTDDSLTHTLTGEAASSGVFAIDAATGQISVADCGSLDYETKSSYTGKVNWTVNNLAAVANLTINVTDVDPERLCPPAAPAVTRTEFSEQTAPALDVTWSDPPDTGATVIGYEAQYRKQGATEWTTAPVPPSTNLLQNLLSKERRLSDLEAGATYEVKVRALSHSGPSPWSDIGSGRANRLPHHADHGGGLYYFYVNNNQPVGKTWVSGNIGTFFADPDGDPLTWDVTSQYPGIGDVGEFRIVDGTVRWTFLFYNPGTLNLTYGGNDGYGGYTYRTFSWSGKQAETRDIAENSPAGTNVGDPVTGTPYDDGDDTTDDSLTYALTGDAATAFVIDSATGQISVKQGATLDYETKSSYPGQVNWTIQGQAAAADLTINVTDVGPGQPGTPAVTRTEFTEQTAPALDVTWTAANANGFTITGYEAQYRIKVAEGETANAWTDYSGTLSATDTTFNLPGLTPGATYEVQVRAIPSDEGPGPWSDTGEGMANRPPHLASAGWGDDSWWWGSSYHFTFWTGHLADSDGDELSRSAWAEYPGIMTVYFEWPSMTIVPRNPATSTITYAAEDGYGGYVSHSFEMTGNANETRNVAENSPAGTHVGRHLGGTPYDDGDDETDDTLTHTIAWDTGHEDAEGLFVLDAATGQLSVAEDAELDHETKDSYTGKVHFTVQGQAALINLTVNVTDVEVGQPAAPSLTRTQFDQESAPALDVTWTAANANGLTITGYNVQYRKKGATEWTEYTVDDGNGGTTAKLPATARTINLPGLEAGATYEAQVRALTDTTTNGEDVGPWSDTGEGTANTPPEESEAPFLGGSFPVGSKADYRETGQGELGVFFEDADSDALTYSASAEHPALLGISLSGAAGQAHLQVTLLNPGASKLHYVARDPYGGKFTRTVTLTGTPKTETRSVPERSPAGTAVGNPVTGVPYDDGDDETDDALTYTLSDGNSGDVEDSFVIDSATGQISVAEDTTLDYETKNSYTGIVSYTVDGHAGTINLTINVTDVEGTIPSAPTVTRTEFSEQSDPALDVAWTGEANGLTISWYKLQYRKKAAEGEDAAEWTLSSEVLQTASARLSDLEPGATYEVQVRAGTNEEGLGPWSDTGEGTANTPPGVAAPSSIVFDGNFGYSFNIQVDALSTDDDGDTLTYSVSVQRPAILRATISGSTVNGTLVNPGASTMTYGAHDPYGGYGSHTLSFSAYGKTGRSVDENSPAGTSVGAPVTGTPYDDGDDQTDDALTYTLQGKAADSELFVINSATGQISVAENAVLDYETDDTHREIEYWPPDSSTVHSKFYRGEVHYTVDGNAASIEVLIGLQDVEAVIANAPTVTRTQFSEQTPPALDVTWAAADANGTTITGYEAQYRIKAAEGETENSWTLYQYDDPEDSNDPPGKISRMPANTTTFNLSNLTAGATYEVQVRAVTSEEGEGPWSGTGEGRANRPPERIAEAAVRSINWKSSAGVRLEWNDIHFNDADGDELTYTVEAEYPGILKTSIGTERLEPSRAALWIRAWNPSAVPTIVTFYAHDGYGGTASNTATVTVTTNEVRSIRENSPAGTAVGQPVAGQPVEGETFSYTLTGEAADAFVINAATGQISVKTGATLDHDTKDSYTGLVEYTVEDQPAAINLTINVTDRLPPRTPGAPSVTKSETNPTDTLDVAWTKPSTSGDRPITDYDVRYRVEGADAWTPHPFSDTATSTSIGGVEAGIAYEVQVRAVNSVGSSGWSESGRGGIAVMASIQAPSDPVPEGSSVDLPVSLSSAMDVAVTVSWRTAGQPNLAPADLAPATGEEEASGTSGDTAQSPEHEHEPSSGTVTFSPGQTSASISITIMDDEEHEGLESFQIELDEVTVESPNLVEIDQGTAPVNILDDDAPPVFTEGDAAVRSVAENTPPGRPIGAPITATDAEGDPLTYTLSGADASSFTLNSATGQLRTSSPLDYESKRTYTGLTVTVDDGHAHTDTISLTVNVTDVDESPTFSPTPAVTPTPTPTRRRPGGGGGGGRPAPTPKPTVIPTPAVTPAPPVMVAPTVMPTPTVMLAPTVMPTPTLMPVPPVGPAPTVMPAPAVEPTPTVALAPPVTPAPTVSPAPPVEPESDSEPTIAPSPEPTPGLSLVSNIRPPQRQLARREVGRVDLSLPNRRVSGAGKLGETPAQVDIPGAGSTSARVVPDGGPGLSLSDPGLWLALSLALLLLPIFFLARRRRKKRREAQWGYTS